MKVALLINKKKLGIAVFLCTMAAAVGVWFFSFYQIYAYTPTMGTVNDGPVRMRTVPVNGETVTSLTQGTTVTVTDEAKGSDGYVWYQIEVSYKNSKQIGYIRSDFITLSTGDSAVPPTEGDHPDEMNGVVSNTNMGVYVRSGAGTSYSTLTKVYKGQPLTILGQTQNGEMIWYNVILAVGGNSYTGWISGDYVTIGGESSDNSSSNGVPSGNAEYIAKLKAAGFPDSYCNALAVLHEKYPSWQFVPVQTGLDWNTVIKNESVVGRNLVQSVVNDSRKSTDNAAYNWKTNSWYGYDGAGWVVASPEFIAYCMDPRNFFNETEIFQFETLEYAAYQKEAGVKNILANTFMAGNYKDRDGVTKSYAKTFVEVGSSLAVSPYHLASRCKQEQGVKGTSPLISGTYKGFEGYYNFFNVGAYTTSQASITVNGLITAKNRGWNSIYKAISGGAAVVADNYVKKGQNTIYFEKFNVVYKSSLYSHQYMTNVMAAISEGTHMGKAYADKNQAFVFRIPVYNNMPGKPVTFTDRGNPNNWLSSLTINGYSLTPSFDGAKTSYSVVVPENTGAVSVSATAVAKTSTISGIGNYSLNYGNNTITVTCISQSGISRNYTITIARGQGTQAGNLIPVADGASIMSVYPVGTYITIPSGKNAGEVLTGIQTKNCTVKFLNKDGSENTGQVGTGNILCIYVKGAEVKRYEVVVCGDINGDGKISNVDLVLMQKQILGIQKQSGCYLDAANTSRDGGVTNKDLVILQKHILNITQIRQ